MRTLSEVKADIIEFIMDSGFTCINAEISLCNHTIVNWKVASELDWKNFILTFIKDSKKDILIIEEITFDSEIGIDSSEVSQLEDKGLQFKFAELLQKMKSFENELIQLKLSVLRENICYQYAIASPSLNELEALENLKDVIIDELDSKLVEESEEKISRRKISKVEISDFVNRILEQEDYYQNAQAYQRKAFLVEFFENELHPVDANDIFTKAEIALEKFLRNRVTELKNSGLSKQEICTTLNMTKNRISRYF